MTSKAWARNNIILRGVWQLYPDYGISEEFSTIQLNIQRYMYIYLHLYIYIYIFTL